MTEFLLLITIITGDGISTEQVKFVSSNPEQRCLEVKKDVESKSANVRIYGFSDVMYKAECIKIF